LAATNKSLAEDRRNYLDSQGSHGFLDDHGTYTTIDPPGSVNTTAVAINAKGDVVGWFQDHFGGQPQGFLYSGGKYTIIQFPGAYRTDLYDINDKGQITGIYVNDTGQHAFVEDHGNYTSLDLNTASSINNNGQVVGFVSGPVTNDGMLATPGNSLQLLAQYTAASFATAATDGGGGTLITNSPQPDLFSQLVVPQS
jgi:probable HAF family extracellular repeat protein